MRFRIELSLCRRKRHNIQICFPEERAKAQGVTDFIIFIFVASGSFLAGSLHNYLGWEIMMFYTSIPISILFLSIVFINPKEIKAI